MTGPALLVAGLASMVVGFLLKGASTIWGWALLAGFLLAWAGLSATFKGSGLVRYAGGVLGSFVAMAIIGKVLVAQPGARRPPTPRPEAENAQQTVALRKHLKENFGMPGYETSWYSSISSASIQGNTAVMKTTLTANGTPAQRICGAASGYVFDNANRALGLQNVLVLSRSGATLIRRQGAAGRCL